MSVKDQPAASARAMKERVLWNAAVASGVPPLALAAWPVEALSQKEEKTGEGGVAPSGAPPTRPPSVAAAVAALTAPVA